MYQCSFLSILGTVSAVVFGVVACIAAWLGVITLAIHLGLLLGIPLVFAWCILFLSTVIWFCQG